MKPETTKLQKYVYAFRASDGSIKIGYTTNLLTRKQVMQTNNGLRIDYLYEFEGDNAKEKEVLRQLRNYYVRGEWINAPVVSVLRAMAKVQGVSLEYAVGKVIFQQLVKGMNSVEELNKFLGWNYFRSELMSALREYSEGAFAKVTLR